MNGHAAITPSFIPILGRQGGLDHFSHVLHDACDQQSDQNAIKSIFGADEGGGAVTIFFPVLESKRVSKGPRRFEPTTGEPP